MKGGLKAKMKFRLKKGKGSVDNFTDAQGVKHFPGDIVDLPESYEGEKWLARIEPEKPQPTMEPVESVETGPDAPLEKSKKRKS